MKYSIIFFIFFKIILFADSLEPFSYKSFSVDSLYSEAKGFYRSKDYDKAIDKLTICQNSIRCSNLLSQIYKENTAFKNIEKSIYFHNISIELGNKSMLHNLGNLYYSIGRVDDAKKSFKEAVKHKFYRSYFNLAKIYQKEKNYSEALKYYKEASKYNISEADYMLGVYYYKRDRNKSIEFFEKASHQGFKEADIVLKKIKNYKGD